MEESGAPPEERLPEVLRRAMALDGEALAEELSLLEAMPQVRLLPSGIFDRAKPVGSKAQLRGVLVALRCCGGQLDQKCNSYEDDNPNACPSHVEAARLLRAKVGSGNTAALSVSPRLLWRLLPRQQLVHRARPRRLCERLLS